jgi:hypothetical protein
MKSSSGPSLNPESTADPVDELRLRRWAREHYVPTGQRDDGWHPIVIDEMRRKDRELSDAIHYEAVCRRIVPLVPEASWTLHGPHSDSAKPGVILRLPAVDQD